MSKETAWLVVLAWAFALSAILYRPLRGRRPVERVDAGECFDEECDA